MTDNGLQSNTSLDNDALVEKLRHKFSVLDTRRFRNLAHDINAATAACAVYLSNLDIHISAVLQGDTHTSHHIQHCADCRRERDLILDILRRERAKEYVPTPNLATPPLSFLRPLYKESSWSMQLSTASTSVRFAFATRYLAHLLLPHRKLPQLNMRVEPLEIPPSRPKLLMIEDIELEDQRVNIQLEATREKEDSDLITIHAIVAGSESLPDNLWAKLTWDEHTFQARVKPVTHDEGEAQFKGIELSNLQAAYEAQQGHFEFALEVRAK